MSNENPRDAKGDRGCADDVGRVRKLPPLSRGERLELADVLVHWSTAVDDMRTVVDEWTKRVDDLRRLGEAVSALEFDRAIADGLNTVGAMAATENLSVDTRTYFRNLLGIAANVEIDE